MSDSGEGRNGGRGVSASSDGVEASFRRLFDATPLGIHLYEIRGDGRLVFVAHNAAADRILGVDNSQFIGKTIEEAFPPLADGEIPIRYRAAALEGVGWQSEQIDYDHGDIRGAFLVTAFQVVPGRVAAMFQDITERKRFEVALHDRAEQLRMLSENLAQGMVYQIDSGPDGRRRRFTYVSPAVERLHGLTAEQVRADPASLYEQIVPEHRERVAEREAEAFAGRGRLDVEVQVRLASGELRWRRFISTPREVSDGSVIWDGIELDVSEQKRTAEEREELARELERARQLELVGRLAGGVAHDINNILQVILGIATLARHEASSSRDVGRDLDEIAAAARRAADLGRQLLAFARRQAVRPRPIDLNATVAELLVLLRRSVGESITLVWEPAAGALPLRIDPAQVDQLLANLCVNARDAIVGAGRITVATADVEIGDGAPSAAQGVPRGRWVRLTVTDDGKGMSSEVARHVFEPLFTTKSSGRGVGLRLSTVLGIVEQNGGFVGVESEPDRGSTFTIHLPRHDGPIEPDGAQQVDVPRGRGETVLLVEDDAAVLRLGAAMLEGLGYVVLAAGGPEEGLRLAEGHLGELRLLLTDVVMPGMNGREFAERLRALRPRLRWLFMSGYTADVLSSRHGVLDEGLLLLHKPFTRDELAIKVREALDSA